MSEKSFPLLMMAGIFRPKWAEPKIKGHFKSQVQDCPSISDIGDEISSKLASHQARIISSARKILPATLIVGLTLLAVARYALNEYRPYPAMAAMTITYATEFVLLLRSDRRNAESRAVLRLFHLIHKLETNPTRWADNSYRWEIAHRIERVAAAVERVSIGANLLSPAVRREVSRMTNSRSACIRGLEMWAIAPGPFSFTDLIERLIKNFLLLLDNRWYELPEADIPQREPSRTRRILFATLAVAVIIGGILVVVFFSTAAGTPILATALGIIGLALLNSAGVPLTSVGQYADISSKVMRAK